MTRGGEREGATATERTTSVTYYDDVPPSKWTKLERIQFLLDRWDDIFGPDIASSLNASRGGSGLDPRLPRMATHKSVRELDRCLGLLVERQPALYRHLKAYRCNAEWRQVRAKIPVKLQSGRWDEIPGWKKERIVPPWISLLKVAKAEVFLVRLFRGDVFIPDDLWDGLTKPC